MTLPDKLAAEFGVSCAQVQAVIRLLDDGNTIPFIARYRKEMTGSLDDQVLRRLADRLAYLRSLQEQREKICASLSERGILIPELEKALEQAATLTEIEDLYRPYRPRRRTRACVAREKGLQPLADRLYAQRPGDDPLRLAGGYVAPDKGVEDAAQALSGAQDILAEQIADDAAVRQRLRTAGWSQGTLCAKAATDQDSVYSLYYAFSAPLRRLAGHQILAINRGEREGFLKVSLSLDRTRAMELVTKGHVRSSCPAGEVVRQAAQDAYTRLIFPATERELRRQLTEKADADAIRVFAVNLRHLLMQPPVKGRTVIGLDPGYRTGCKAAVVDATGKVLDTGVIYPVPPHNRVEEAKALLRRWVDAYHATVFAIGNGTASRETEAFAAACVQEFDCGLAYVLVNEAGASVYSASPLAAEEFPEYDVSLRSAISIARRLQDPLAELVKIDPASIGVGQYQHDMPPRPLAEALDGVVEDCVNTVGVDLNTASAPLLARVAGIGPSLAKNIVAHREENGPFPSRSALKKVPKLGAKAFEQSAGFLRVPESRNPLDHTAVHPESYPAAKQLLSLCGPTPAGQPGTPSSLTAQIRRMGEEKLAQQLGIGVPTLRDIAAELDRPGRDPRDELPLPLLRTDVLTVEDLSPGMELAGTVRNVIDFGAFVDIGVHQDGLVHISQITDRYLRHPSEVLKVGDTVTVWVLGVDPAKKRISLTMKPPKKNPETE